MVLKVYHLSVYLLPSLLRLPNCDELYGRKKCGNHEAHAWEILVFGGKFLHFHIKVCRKYQASCPFLSRMNDVRERLCNRYFCGYVCMYGGVCDILVKFLVDEVLREPVAT